jgi:hypothetical protein
MTVGFAHVVPGSGPGEGVGEHVTFAIHPAAVPAASDLKCEVRHPPETFDITMLPHPALLVGPAKLKSGIPEVSAVKVLDGVPLKIFNLSPASFNAMDVNEMVTYWFAVAGQIFTSPFTLLE